MCACFNKVSIINIKVTKPHTDMFKNFSNIAIVVIFRQNLYNMSVSEKVASVAPILIESSPRGNIWRDLHLISLSSSYRHKPELSIIELTYLYFVIDTGTSKNSQWDRTSHLRFVTEWVTAYPRKELSLNHNKIKPSYVLQQ